MFLFRFPQYRLNHRPDFRYFSISLNKNVGIKISVQLSERNRQKVIKFPHRRYSKVSFCIKNQDFNVYSRSLLNSTLCCATQKLQCLFCRLPHLDLAALPINYKTYLMLWSIVHLSLRAISTASMLPSICLKTALFCNSSLQINAKIALFVVGFKARNGFSFSSSDSLYVEFSYSLSKNAAFFPLDGTTASSPYRLWCSEIFFSRSLSKFNPVKIAKK